MTWRFNHAGMATRSIDQALSRLSELEIGSVSRFTDPLQGVSGAFVEIGDARLELLEPLDHDQTLEPWLQQGNRLYQVAFEVDNLDDELAKARARQIRVLREPRPAVAFGGRRVAFLMPIPGLLIELIDSDR